MEALKQDKCMVSGKLAYVLCLSRIVGIAPISMRAAHPNYRIGVSYTACLYGRTLNITVSLVSALACAMWIYVEVMNRTKASRVIIIFATMFSPMLVQYAEMYNGIRRMRIMIECLKQIQMIDNELRSYGCFSTLENTKRWMVIGAFAGSVYIVTGCGYFFEASLLINNFFPAFYVQLLGLQLLVLQISFLHVTELSTFDSLNNCLWTLLQKMDTESSIKTAPETIQCIANNYCCLNNIVHRMNKAYEVLLITLFLHLQLHFVVSLYYLISDLSSHIDLYTLVFIEFAWIIYHTVHLLMIVEPCHRTQKQMKRTKQLISQLMLVTKPSNYKLMAELEMFYKTVISNDIVYTPMKMFKLNRSVLVTFLGATVSYLVVVLQLEHT